MADTNTKNIILSQSKVGQGDDTRIPTLSHTVIRNETSIEVKVEVPGVDPNSIVVGFENNQIQVQCERGSFSLSVDPTIDTSKIKADIMWGMLTLQVPLPEPPVSRSIKVNIHDFSEKKVVASKPTPVKTPTEA